MPFANKASMGMREFTDRTGRASRGSWAISRQTLSSWLPFSAPCLTIRLSGADSTCTMSICPCRRSVSLDVKTSAWSTGSLVQSSGPTSKSTYRRNSTEPQPALSIYGCPSPGSLRQLKSFTKASMAAITAVMLLSTYSRPSCDTWPRGSTSESVKCSL